MKRSLFLILVALPLMSGPGVVSAAGPQAVPAAAAGQPTENRKALLDRYCVTCHNARLKTADLSLENIDLTHIPAGAATWEKVVRKLRTGAMPPAGRPRPDKQ